MKKMTAAEYRTLDADGLEARRAEVINELNNADSELTMEELRSEVNAIEAEVERRNMEINLRAANISAVAGGAGQLMTRGSQAPAKEEDLDYTDTPEYRNAFMMYVTRGIEIPMELRTHEDDEFTMTTDVPVQIPKTLMKRIVEEMDTYGDIWKRVTKLNVKGGIAFPVLDLKPVATWIGEDEVSPYQKVESKKTVTFLFHTLECRLAQTILASVTTFDAFQARFVPLVAEAMVRALEQAIIRGTGDGQFLGITKDPEIPASRIVEMTMDELNDWKAWHQKVKKVMGKSYRHGEFIMSQASWDAYIETMEDDEHRPISNTGYNAVTGEEQYRFMGKKATTVEPDILPDFDAAEAGDVVCIFGDLSNYVVNSQMNVQTVRWIDHETNKVKTKAMLIADGKVLDPYGFILVKKKAKAGASS